MRRSRVCDLLGIKYPILMGAGWEFSRPQLCVAVSEAGGLGQISSTFTGKVLREEIRKVRAQTDKPFSVNIALVTFQGEGGRRHKDDVLDVLFDEGITLVQTSAGSPSMLTSTFKEHGITVIHVVANVYHARKAQAAGVDMIVASGFEAASIQSYDQISTLALIPQVVDAVTVPVIAAGGIGDARGLAAAFALGAEGVQMGTRFLATEEAPVPDEWKQLILQADERSTEIVVGRSGIQHGDADGIPSRILRKSFVTTEYASRWPGKRIAKQRMPAGQVAGLIHDIVPVRGLLDDMMAGADRIVHGLIEDTPAVSAASKP